MKFLIRIWRQWRAPAASCGLSDMERAMALIEAIDRGGVASDPIRINAIARSLGLEVSRQAEMAETVQRIRAVIERAKRKGYD